MYKLTILCENSVVPALDILGEHGFAVLIETNGLTYLFDTGQGHTILHNADCLKKNLADISGIFLSHGHIDHTGGLARVLSVTGKVNVYAHPDIFIGRYSMTGEKGKKEIVKSIGMPETIETLEDLGAHFVFNMDFVEAAPNIFMTGVVPRLTSFEKPDRRLRVKKNKRLVQDSLEDDQSIVLKTRKGLIVVLGCAHSGIINTLNYIRQKLPGHKIHMVVGGNHIGFLTDTQADKTIESLNAFSIKRIGVSHCTGLAPSMKLMQKFGERFFFANAGSVIEL